MKMIKYILFSVSAFLAASCSLLDTEPQDFIDPNDYYATEGQLQAALNGVYATMAPPCWAAWACLRISVTRPIR